MNQNSKAINQAEFKELFEIYYPRLVLFASKFVNNSQAAEDCVLESFNALWKNREAIESQSYIKSYLYKSVKNKCLNVLRHSTVSKILDIDDRINDIADDSCIEFSIIDSELHSKLLEAIEKLPEDARQILEYNVFEKIKMHEIADQLDISLNQVKALKTKALRELKKNLGKNYVLVSILFDLV